jgi:ankyrin repeat protein
VSVIAALKLVDSAPSICISIRQTLYVVDGRDPKSIIYLARNGSITEMRQLLETRPGSVCEVDFRTGWSALVDCLSLRHFEQATLLLAAGVDPFLESYSGIPAIYHGIYCLYQRPRSIQMDDLKRYLPFSDFFEEYGLSHVHKVILGIRPLSLHIELKKTAVRDQVNEQDQMGRTPLHWAARKGDASAVDELLQAGACANVFDKEGRTPLFDACLGSFIACAERILVFGGDVDAPGPRGYQPIHAATKEGSAKLISLLLLHKAELDASNNHFGATPLQQAVGHSNVRGCRHLLDLGADIEHEDRDGDTPLFQGVVRNAHDCLQLLLSRESNHLHRNHNRCTLLHLAALHGDQGTFKILAEADLNGIDIDARDNKSMCARHYFAARRGTSLEHREAFDNLINSLSRLKGNVGINTIGEDDDGDIFYDASEN